MRCINKKAILLCTALLLAVLLCGCGNSNYQLPYQADNEISSFNIANTDSGAEKLSGFAENLCVAPADVNSGQLALEPTISAGLFSLNNKETIYAKNVNAQLHPASLTKIMTALVAMKYGTPDQMLTASDNVIIEESGVQLCGIKAGDQMTLDQALHVLLIQSANDVAIMIAENIGGSVAGFTELMNQEARSIGATNSHFVNPNGLTEDNHYVSAYDMYLIFNEAIKQPLFTEIIQMDHYSTVYYNSKGSEINLEIASTNLFLRGDYKAPSETTVIGGKTGTTNAAGHCIILYSKDQAGAPYISVMMNAPTKDDLYTNMSSLLALE